MPYYLNLYQPGLGSSLTGTPGRTSTGGAFGSSGAFGQPLFALATTTTTGTTTGTAATQSQATGFTTLGMSKAPAYVTALSPDFAITRVSSSKLQSELLATLQRSSALRGQGKIDLTVTKNGQVILKGDVSRDQLRRLAEGLVRMTPGVSDVQNELQVTAAQKQ
jgi:BON domain-containing protein